MKTSRISLIVAALCALSAAATAQQDVPCAHVDTVPVIDGKADDPVWSDGVTVTTRDAVAPIAHRLRCVYTDDQIYFLVRFPDEDENREHKTLVWDDDQQRYRIGATREDAFVFKWNMGTQPVDLTLSSDDAYKADIWYWKSVRTDHAGHADDKVQIYASQPVKDGKKQLSKGGRVFYLTRSGDDGEAAYAGRQLAEFDGETTPNYALRSPSGSRADVRAKGRWNDGSWSVEFARRLNTGHADDVQLEPGRSYQFGVSRFEIAGRVPDPKIQVPEFGSGEIGETLSLVFLPKS